YRKQSNQRQAANSRERKRMKTMNSAFEILRQRLPMRCKSLGDKKLSKVDTLRSAVDYIRCLVRFLAGDENEEMNQEDDLEERFKGRWSF
ncbi:hypothetical protein HELRODRAFT_76346, partial [Helobdella robusta]|uniref:BHLH domain-containing protein n=1 Tax=Helobdella robusta TaxID=6412 RepID=T1G2I6_HELRO